MKAENKMNVWLATNIATLKENVANPNCSKKDREIYLGELGVYEKLFREIAFEGRELNVIAEEVLNCSRRSRGEAKASFNAYEKLKKEMSDESENLV